MTALELRAVKERLGWTTERLAEALGLTDRHIRRYLSGERPISAPIAKLARYVEREHAPHSP